MDQSRSSEYSAYIEFTREQWAQLRSNTPLTLSEQDLQQLRGVNDKISLSEVEDIHLPLSRLLNLHFRSARGLNGVKDEFLGRLVGSRPYVIAVAGSVAVGKSTFARVLQALLAHWPDHPSVALVTTDGFLYSLAELRQRDLLGRKGFPESYDRRRMVEFLAGAKAGRPTLAAPVYSHQSYDLVPNEWQVVEQPDILIFEGLNVLQPATLDRTRNTTPSIIVSDFFDFSLYIDADEEDIERWYIQRFLSLQQTVFQDPTSYFHHFRDLTREQSILTAQRIWREINLVNLHENIAPTRERANVVLRKRSDHSIDELWLRQF